MLARSPHGLRCALAAVLVLVALAAPPARAQPAAPTSSASSSPAEDAVAARAAASVVQVLTRYGMGSGVMVDNGIITNSHVLRRVDVVELVLPDGSTIVGHVVRRDNQSDLAVIASDARLPSLPIVSESDPQGARVATLGFPTPGALVGKFVTAWGTLGPTLETSDGIKLVRTDAAGAPGSSGGPLINTRGEIVGLVEGSLTRETTARTVAISAEVVRTFLAAPIAALPQHPRLHAAVQVLEMRTNDLVVDPVSGLLFASIPTASAHHGATVLGIDPSAIDVRMSIPTGGEPHRLAISPDGQYLYAGINAEGAVRRVSLASEAPDLTFPLGRDSRDRPQVAGDLVALPGEPPAVVVARWQPCCSAHDSGTFILDESHAGSVPDTRAPTLGTRLAVSEDGAIFAHDNETTAFELHRVRPGPDGNLESEQVRDRAVSDFYESIVAQGDWVFATSGDVFDAVTLETRLELPADGPVAPDVPNSRVYMLAGEGRHRLLVAFELDSGAPLWSIELEDVLGQPDRLVRWGAAGLAFRTSGGQLFIISPSE